MPPYIFKTNPHYSVLLKTHTLLRSMLFACAPQRSNGRAHTRPIIMRKYTSPKYAKQNNTKPYAPFPFAKRTPSLLLQYAFLFYFLFASRIMYIQKTHIFYFTNMRTWPLCLCVIAPEQFFHITCEEHAMVSYRIVVVFVVVF